MITFTELKNISSESYPAILLEKYSTYRGRRKTRTALLWLMIIVFVLMIMAPFIAATVSGFVGTFFLENTFLFRGLFFMIIAIWINLYMVEAFYLSYYFKQNRVDFDVAKLSTTADREDITGSFLNSVIGRYVMMRLGVRSRSLEKFLEDSVHIRDVDVDIDVDHRTKLINIKHYGQAVYRQDLEFQEFLNRHSVSESDFLGALDWVDNDEWKVRNVERWWSRDRLSRVQNLGRRWSFGQTHLIEKFGYPIMAHSVYQNLGEKWRVYTEEVHRIENVLVKSSNMNAMLISPSEKIGLEIVASLNSLIVSGKSLVEIEDYKIFVLDLSKILHITGDDRRNFDTHLRSILKQAEKTGRIILTLTNFSGFVEKVEDLKVLNSIFESENVHVVALVDKEGYYGDIEPNVNLVRHFEKVEVGNLSREVIIRTMQDEVHRLEREMNIFITYKQIVSAIVENDLLKSMDNLRQVTMASRIDKNATTI